MTLCPLTSRLRKSQRRAGEEMLKQEKTVNLGDRNRSQGRAEAPPGQIMTGEDYVASNTKSPGWNLPGFGLLSPGLVWGVDAIEK